MEADRVHMHGFFNRLPTTRAQFKKWVSLTFILTDFSAVLRFIFERREEAIFRICITYILCLVHTLWNRGHFVDEAARNLVVLHVGHGLIEVVVLRHLNLPIKVLLISASIHHIVVLNKLRVLCRVEEVWLHFPRENG